MTTTVLFVVTVLLLFQHRATAYLNGANPNSELPTTNERYAFLTKPHDKYFTSKGILPPLLSASDCQLQQQQQQQQQQQPESDIWVTYTNDPTTVDDWLCRNVPYDGCFLGFDIERLPECRSKTCHADDKYAFAHAAVVQLATPTACLVVQLVDATHCPQQNHPRHSNACARLLKSVLEDPSIIKAGCSIDEDLVLLHELWDKSHQHDIRNHKKRLHKKKRNPKTKPNNGVRNRNHHQHHHHVPSLQARSRFDLGCVVLPKNNSMAVVDNEDVAMNYKFVARKTTTISNKSGLRGLCEFVLGVDLPKEKDTCASDWTQFPLSDEQITYAARDAWAGATIATKLAEMEEYESHDSSSNSTNTSTSSDDHGHHHQRVFSRPNLIQVLRKTETPLPQLALRHRQRKEAKSELRTLLHPYARNLFLNQQNFRRQQELEEKQEQQHYYLNQTTISTLSNGNSLSQKNKYKHNNTIIDVSALFADYPLSSRRTLANYAQQQQQLMEKSLPKQIRKRSIVLRQTVNAKVIDHKLVFEVDMMHPNKSLQNANLNKKNPVPSSSSNNNNNNNKHHTHHHRGRKRRNHQKRARDSNSSKNHRR